MTAPAAGAVRVVLPAMLQELTDGVAEVRTGVPDEGAALAAVLDDALRPWPRVQARVRDERGEIRRHVNVFVDGEDVKRGGGTGSLVRPGAVVHIINAVSGG